MANALLTSSNAKHIEISRRYAWHARQRRGGSKLARSQVFALVRMRELERIFQHRYVRFLPDDDAGRDDLVLAAHQVAHLKGDAVAHILAWAQAWAPWMPQSEAREIAERVAAAPLRFTADKLAWRLRLSMVERTVLKITTIGAFDCSKSERAELRKKKDRDAKRAHRAKTKSGRPRGRPKKTVQINASTAVKGSIAVDGFSEPTEVIPTPDGIDATKPPAEAVGTPSKKDSFERVDGAAVVGDPIRRFKTRFTATRLDKEMKAYALAAGFEPFKIQRMFESFGYYHIAKRSFSADWRQAWFNWVDREVDIVMERHHRERAQRTQR